MNAGRQGFTGLLAALLLLSAAHTGMAQSKTTSYKASSLDELLQQVRSESREQDAKNKKREAEFLAARDKQKELLEQAKSREKAQVEISEALERKFEANERQAAELQELLRKRLGTFGELFGVVRQVAGETRAQIQDSLISSQLPGREALLEKLAQSESLPDIEQLEQLWYVLQQEMTESGKVVRFETEVVGATGKAKRQQVTRVGAFNAVSQGQYLRWMPETQQLAVLVRQPESRYQSTVDELEKASGGNVRFAVDPSRGSILALLLQTPDFWERIDLGGYVGWTIIYLGGFTFAIAVLRLLYIAFVAWKVRRQEQDLQNIRPNNPLGRVLAVFSQRSDPDADSLEHRLDEAVLRESGRLERYLWAIKVVSVVAPLMGLLGTVTGMIQTFQAITLFGTGDPKLMAGGISEALVTTMLGLCVAIPLVLIHSGLGTMCRRVIDVLEEQSAGMMALQAHKEQA